MKFLIIEDDADTRRLTRTILEQEGFEVLECEGGAGCLDLIEETRHTLDAVILDLSMPVLDGLTLAEQIRLNEKAHRQTQPLRLAFYTARTADEATLRIAERTNVERIFRKPHDTENLTALIREWLDNPKQSAANQNL